MKKLMVGLVLASSVTSVMARTSATGFAGEFQATKQIYFHNYINGDECRSDSGEWQASEDDPEIGYCFYQAVDSVKVENTQSGYMVRVDTVGTNGHSCLFDGEAKKVAGNQINATAEAEYYDSQSNSWKVGTCTVKVIYKTPDVVDVVTDGPCDYFWGAKAQLDMENAVRK